MFFDRIVLVAFTMSLGAAGICGSAGSGQHFSGEVKIGLEAPLSGDQATLGEGMLHGAELAAIHLNAIGGIKHKQVVIVPIDDAATSSVGIEAARTAIKAGIKGVVGPYNSGVGIYTLPIYLKAGLLPIRLTSNNATDAMGYTLQPMADEIAPMAAEALVTWQQVQKVGILYDSTQNYTSGIAASLKSLLEQAGVTVTSYTSITPGAASYSSEVTAAAALNPDVIYAATYFPEGGLIAKAMFDQHVAAKCVVDYASDDPGFITVAGLDAAMASEIVGVPSPTDFPEGPAFAAEYLRTFGEEPGTWSPYTFDSVNLFADAVKTAGTYKSKRVKRVLDSISFWLGITGSVTFNPATGNRIPATLVMLQVNAQSHLIINQDWADAVGAPF